MPTTRFAPSPTGRLHLGHAFSAMLAHDLARAGSPLDPSVTPDLFRGPRCRPSQDIGFAGRWMPEPVRHDGGEAGFGNTAPIPEASGGRFLLRIEDIDGARSSEAHVAGIEADLLWLGLKWDGPVLRQSSRLGAYADALDELRTRGLLYPCFCTRRDIAAAASAPHGLAGPVYPGTCRGLADPPLGRPHAWRLDMTRAVATVGPLTFGESGRMIIADPAAHGDVVLGRKDAPASYHLAATLDDAHQGVTDVVRGEDLLPATHIHRLLQALLALPTPRYRHHRLLTDAAGRRLAKRDGSPTLAELRAKGVDPAALLAELRLASGAQAITLPV